MFYILIAAASAATFLYTAAAAVTFGQKTSDFESLMGHFAVALWMASALSLAFGV